VFASGVGHCLGQPQLRGERRLERPRRGTEDQGRAAGVRNGGTGGRLRRPGQGEARGGRPRHHDVLSCGKAERWPAAGWEVVANLETRCASCMQWGGRQFRVALPPAEIPASREPGLRLNPQLRRISAEMRAELTSAEIAMSGSYFDDVLRDSRYGIENTTDKLRRPGAVRRRRYAVCTESIVGHSENGLGSGSALCSPFLSRNPFAPANEASGSRGALGGPLGATRLRSRPILDEGPTF